MGQVHRALPSCQLTDTFLPITENEAQSDFFALKKLTFDDQLPNRPKGASKLPSFHASLVVRTHLAVYRGSESTSFFCLLVSNEAHVVSIGAQGPGIFAQLTREHQPKPDKALKASATSVNPAAHRSHGPCGAHASGQGDLLPPTDQLLSLGWRSACCDLKMVDGDCLRS